MISIHDSNLVKQFFIKNKIDINYLRRFRNAYYKKSLPFNDCLTEIPITKQQLFKATIQTDFLNLVHRSDSKIDGCSKLVFKTKAGHRLETVILRIDSGRTSLCISSQIGCAVKCHFCATGNLNTVINLSYNEIIDQIICANDILRTEGRQVRNVVFMGMGEPMHNYTNLTKAIDVLKSDKHFKFTTRRIIVSTVGVIDKMLKFNQQYPEIGLALSLHSALQHKRQQIIPIANKYNLADLHKCLSTITTKSKSPIMLEYLMLQDITDSQEDLNALLKFCKNLNVHINLIPYNTNPQAPTFLSSNQETIQYFADTLKNAGLKTTLRYSLGSDIEAACGQLV